MSQDETAAEARRLLKTIPTDALRDGMKAFPYRGWRERANEGGVYVCFLGLAFSKEAHGNRDRAVSLGRLRGLALLESIYEGWMGSFSGLNAEWLHSECLRELAERGEVVEQPVAAPALVG
jgi:hypothetical protein